MTSPIIVGAVLYDPKVSVIWNIIRDFFEANECPIDVVFFTNYELQVTSLLNGRLDIAWNSPLAWLDAQRRSGGHCRAIAMRDTDQDRTSHLVTRRASGIETVADLAGRTMAVGAKDSPQATLIPLGMLRRSGLEPGRHVEIRRHDVLVGKHGDHVGGELEAFGCLERGEASASAMIDLNWEAWTGDGTIDAARFAILASTPTYDHCVFTVRDTFFAEAENRWLDVLYSMSYEQEAHREMMDLEGLKQWLPGRTSGFGLLEDAVISQRFFERE